MASVSYRGGTASYNVAIPVGYFLRNVKDSNAYGDGSTDDRTYIQSAITTAIASSYGGIAFPTGTYAVSKGSNNCSIDLNGVSTNGFVVQGTGWGSKVKMIGSGASSTWHMFRLRNSVGAIVFDSLDFDGNKLNLTNLDEQTHILRVESGIRDVIFRNCRFRNSHGDGLNLIATTGSVTVERLIVDGCTFDTCYRSGIVVQRGVRKVIIVNSHFTNCVNDQLIDFEPTGNTEPQDITIANCILNHTNLSSAVALSGISGTERSTRVTMSNCILTNGNINAQDTEELTLDNVRVIQTSSQTANKPPVELGGGMKNVTIMGGYYENNSTATEGCIVASGSSNTNDRKASTVKVLGVTCLSTVATAGIRLQSGNRIEALGNTVMTTSASGSTGIHIRAESTDCYDVLVNDNNISAQTPGGGGTWTTAGIQIQASPQNMYQVTSVGNNISYATVGTTFQGSGFQRIPYCANNHDTTTVTSPVTFSTSNQPICTGGNQGSVAHYMGTGAPSHSAGKFSIYYRTNGTAGSGGTAGTARYMNTNGATTWAALIDS